MNEIVVTLISVKPCELKRFLSNYYEKEMPIEEGTFRWSSSFQSALKSSLILATLMDNVDDYHIEALISIGHNENMKVSKENINELVKVLYLLEKKI